MAVADDQHAENADGKLDAIVEEKTTEGTSAALAEQSKEREAQQAEADVASLASDLEVEAVSELENNDDAISVVSDSSDEDHVPEPLGVMTTIIETNAVREHDELLRSLNRTDPGSAKKAAEQATGIADRILRASLTSGSEYGPLMHAVLNKDESAGAGEVVSLEAAQRARRVSVTSSEEDKEAESA